MFKFKNFLIIEALLVLAYLAQGFANFNDIFGFNYPPFLAPKCPLNLHCDWMGFGAGIQRLLTYAILLLAGVYLVFYLAHLFLNKKINGNPKN